MSTMALLLFLVCAFLAVGTAVATVALRSPLRAAVTLLLHILSLAGIFLTLEAHMLAAIQVLVYAGAVVVLFVFVIMLIGPDAAGSRGDRGTLVRTVSFALMALVAVGLASALIKYDKPRQRVVRCADDLDADCGQFGGVEAIAGVMFQPSDRLTRNWRGRIGEKVSALQMVRDRGTNSVAMTIDGRSVPLQAEEEHSIYTFDVGRRNAELNLVRSGDQPGEASLAIGGEALAPVGAGAQANDGEDDGDSEDGDDEDEGDEDVGGTAASLATAARFDAGPGSGEITVALADGAFRPIVRVDGRAATPVLQAHSGRYRFSVAAGSGVLAMAEPRGTAQPSYELLFGDINLPGGQLEVGAALPFELAGILLLVAVIGAIAVARGRSAKDAKAARERRLAEERWAAAKGEESATVGGETATAPGGA